MGNRAEIIIEGQENSIFLHWQGGKGSVKAFVEEALKRCPDIDNNAFIYELYAAIKDFFSFAGDKRYRERRMLNVYIIKSPKLISKKYAQESNIDNGVYKIQKDGKINYDYCCCKEGSAYTKETYNYISLFFQEMEELLKATDWGND